jgi:RND family efflux transporter MFP subunit
MGTVQTVWSVMVAASLAAGCTKVEGQEARALQPVRASTPTVALLPGGVRYSATIEPYDQVSLAFKTSGYVDQVLRRTGPDGRQRTAQAGDPVARGTVLARVREQDARERVGQARARITEGEASLTKARLDLERALALYGAESLIKPDLDTAQAAFDGAGARMQSARAESALRDCVLVAPSGGVILERSLEPGMLASPGTPGFVIGDVSSVKARFGIPDSMLGSIALGAEIGVTVDAMAGTTFTGRLTAIAPAADPQSRVFDVEVTIPNADGKLRPGMIGTVTVGIDAAAAAMPRPLTVPLTAVVRADGATGRFAVFVVERDGGSALVRQHEVELGEVLGNDIAVTRGLRGDERVVTSGATLLHDGEAVTVLE